MIVVNCMRKFIQFAIAILRGAMIFSLRCHYILLLRNFLYIEI